MLRRWPVGLFVLWTAYVWTTRIVNAWTASDESVEAKAVSTGVAVGLLGAAVAGAAVLVRARARTLSGTERGLFVWFARATIAIWAVRIVQILADGNRDLPFKAVHVVLGVVSVVLAVATMVIVSRERVTGVEGVDAGGGVGAVSPGQRASR